MDVDGTLTNGKIYINVIKNGTFDTYIKRCFDELAIEQVREAVADLALPVCE